MSGAARKNPASGPGGGEGSCFAIMLTKNYRNRKRYAMHITLCFSPDGTVDFFPQADNPQKLAIEFAKVISILNEHPERIICAAGACGGGVPDDAC
jgi:hypothetical protein